MKAYSGLVLLMAAPPCNVLSYMGPQRANRPSTFTVGFGVLRAAKEVGIEFQSDSAKFGRGEMHLSAALNIGDVVVYQTGVWLVDGVRVGDDIQPEFRYGRVETIQLVWTHNCEHGVIRALPLSLLEAGENDRQVLKIEEEEEFVEFGPEQLVAKLPIIWGQEAKTMECPVALGRHMWDVEEDGVVNED
jgi:hypothetical protein